MFTIENETVNVIDLEMKIVRCENGQESFQRRALAAAAVDLRGQNCSAT
jgi:hypothetical protein